MTNDDVDLTQWVRALITGVPAEMHAPTVARACLAAGRDPFPALEALSRITATRDAQRPPRPRSPSALRLRRAEERQPLPTTQYAPATALEPLNDPLLSASAKVLLMHVRALAGVGRVLETLTASLATLLGCSRRAIQIWRAELVDAGLLTHSYDPRRGTVTLTVTDLVVPAASSVATKVRAPAPDMRFRDRWKARMAALRRLGRVPGANHRAPIKQLNLSMTCEIAPA